MLVGDLGGLPVDAYLRLIKLRKSMLLISVESTVWANEVSATQMLAGRCW